MDTSLRDHLLSNVAFQKLAEASLDAVVAASREMDLDAGQVILKEGEHDSDLVLILSGTARAFRVDNDGHEVELNEIQAGDCIGELSLLDEGRRTASVKALTDCSIIRVHVDQLTDLSVVGDLKAALATIVVRRVRLLSDEMLASMRAQLEARTLQNQFGYFLIFTIAIFIISTSIFYLVAEDYVEDVYDPGFSWQTVLLFAVPCLFIIRVLKIPLHDLGIKRDGLWTSVWQALAFCVVLSSPALIYMLFFREPVAAEDRPVQITTIFLAQYFLHTVVQEIGARGLIQGLFVKFLDDQKGHRAVLLSSTIFASLHVTLGLDAVILTFFAGIVFGYAYHFQKNLAGVIIIHYWFGVLAASLVAL
ncbi:cyclic nucleotide-binding domain-containing protein [Aestuariivita sp.]|jgi:CRP-like cAMP-binding protein|uniref:cyclic nucleotide-binding domain-containing protein n=1 Tax=Aestuariivita sp. TaxID=1872407 RepID=UPI002171385E|nr:cyclic nucleotide-binding domain-containing protein [Aestuariivita sp.]MCE8009015.1 cyclic nucleotide-binding domain-containing protein [Aestuariivita sp.]